MKKLFTSLFILFFSMAIYANKYAELTIVQAGLETKPTTFFDDGSGKVHKVSNPEGRKFVSPVAAVNYFKEQGWEVKIISVSTMMGNVIRVYTLTAKK